MDSLWTQLLYDTKKSENLNLGKMWKCLDADVPQMMQVNNPSGTILDHFLAIHQSQDLMDL